MAKKNPYAGSLRKTDTPQGVVVKESPKRTGSLPGTHGLYVSKTTPSPQHHASLPVDPRGGYRGK